MSRWGGIACVACLVACSTGVPPNPFGGVTGGVDDDESDTSGDPNTTLSTISESATTPSMTTGTSLDTGESSSSGAPVGGSDTGTTGGEVGGSSSGGESSSSTGDEPVAMCASSNTLEGCAVAGSNSRPFMQTMLCTTDTTFSNPEVYDFFVIDVASDDCVFVQVDNTGGNGDVMAYVVDANEAYFGLEDDYTELDDEIACTAEPWNGFACPRAGVSANASGRLTIAVGQWGNTPDCTDNAPYTLWVAVNGTDLDMSDALVLDDHVVDPLTCP